MANEALDSLLAAFFSQTSTPEQIKQLDEALANEPGAAERFVRFTIDQNLLEHHVRVNSSKHYWDLAQDAELSEDEDRDEAIRQLRMLGEIESRAITDLVDVTDLASTQRHTQSNRGAGTVRDFSGDSTGGSRIIVIPKPLIWIAAAAALGIIAWVGVIQFKPSPSDPVAASPALPAPAPVVAAVVSHAMNDQWQGYSKNQPFLMAGQVVTLEQGVAKCTFGGGASVVIEGPAEIEFLDTNAMRLKRGRLAALVPPEAIGFKVYTPTGVVTDLGTEFGVDVQAAGKTTTHVFQGLVNLSMTDRTGKATSQEVQVGQTWIADNTGLRRNDAATAQMPFLRVVPSEYELAVRRLRPIGYWRFDSDTDGRAKGGLGTLDFDGQYVGGVEIGVPGPGLGGPQPNQAVRFDGSGTHITIPDQAGLPLIGQAYSVAMWVKPERIGAQCFIVRTDDSGTEFNFTHQLRMTVDGRFEHYTYTTGNQKLWTLTGQTIAETGKWHHVVITADEIDGTLRLFVNGREDAAALDFDEPLTTAMNQWQIAAPTNRSGNQPNAPRVPAATGVIDEVAIFNYALSPDQVRALMDPINPSSIEKKEGTN